jgi:hypothetical protein
MLSLYRVYHLKRNPTTITYYGTKMKSEAGPPRVIDSPNFHRDTRVVRPPLTLVAPKLCRCEYWCIHEQNVCSFSNITPHRNHLLLFVKHLAVRYPDKEVPNKTIHRLVTKFQARGSVCDREHVRRRTVCFGVKRFCKLFLKIKKN